MEATHTPGITVTMTMTETQTLITKLLECLNYIPYGYDDYEQRVTLEVRTYLSGPNNASINANRISRRKGST